MSEDDNLANQFQARQPENYRKAWDQYEQSYDRLQEHLRRVTDAFSMDARITAIAMNEAHHRDKEGKTPRFRDAFNDIDMCVANILDFFNALAPPQRIETLEEQRDAMECLTALQRGFENLAPNIRDARASMEKIREDLKAPLQDESPEISEQP